MKFINPTLNCECKELNKKKYLEYNEPPPGEINLGLDLKKYKRLFYQCFFCKHLFAHHLKFKNKNLYREKYVQATYGSYEGIKKNFLKIRSINKKKSDNNKRCDRLEKFINFKKNYKILDVGSGLGIFPYEFYKRGYRITCNDPDKNCVKFISEELKLNIISKNFLNFRNKKEYNLITFNKVLEHLENPKKFIMKARSILKKHGFIYLEVPDIDAIKDKIGKNREEFLMGHYHVFSKKSLRTLINACKIKILKLESIRDPSGKYTIFSFCQI